MTPEEVPQDLVDAATFAFAAKAQADGDTGFIDYARTMLAAVLPLHEQQVRDQIAGSLWQLPIVQHLGIFGSQPESQCMANTAEAALRFVLTLVLHPDRIPERKPW